jgi:hypothetical protein
MKPGDLEDRLINFAVRVLNVTESLPNTKAGNDIVGQLVRSGTSPPTVPLPVPTLVY